MNLGLLYYLITIASFASGFFSVLLGLSIISFVIITISLFDSDKKDRLHTVLKDARSISLVLILISALITALVPNKKDMLIISGLTIGNESIAKTVDSTLKVAPELIELLRKELKQELDK